jgi:hypothetical protein
MNEIEQDDDEDAIIYSKSDYFDDELNSVEGVNWLQEAAEQQIQEEDKNDSSSINTSEKNVSFDDHLNASKREISNDNNLEENSKSPIHESI